LSLTARKYEFRAAQDISNCTFCVELHTKKSSEDAVETERTTLQEENDRLYQLLQQKLKQADETVATMMEQTGRLQQETSQLFAVILSATLLYSPMIYSCVLLK